jgi:hypothetical protein
MRDQRGLDQVAVAKHADLPAFPGVFGCGVMGGGVAGCGGFAGHGRRNSDRAANRQGAGHGRIDRGGVKATGSSSLSIPCMGLCFG